MKKVLWVSDGYVPTGFGRVAHAILDRLHKKYEIHHLAINYRGQPHNFPWKLYPAMVGGDMWGIKQVPLFLREQKFDALVILNDIPVIDAYLTEIRKNGVNNLPRIVVYFPVDSKYMTSSWFKNYDMVSEIAVYSQFGFSEIYPILEGKFTGKIRIVRHGVDRNKFTRIPKETAVEIIINELAKEQDSKFVDALSKKLLNTQIFLNANRNQPRKKIDLTISGFAEFVRRNKLTPEDVSLYLHMGVVDNGVDIVKLSSIYGISDYVILTHSGYYHKFVSDEVLNAIYNVADYGVNTSMGEGFGLVSVEHASVGKPQIVPNNSVLPEIWKDKAYYIECPVERWADITTVLFMEATKETVANALEEAYYDNPKKIMTHVFEDKEYSWSYIAKQFMEMIDGG